MSEDNNRLLACCDRQRTFSVEVAQTIGVEQAIMLQGLSEMAVALRLSDATDPRQGSFESLNHSCVRFTRSQLQSWFPFWSYQELRAIADKLCAQGLIFVESQSADEGDGLAFRFKPEPPQRAESLPFSDRASPASRKSRAMPEDWQPGREAVFRLGSQGISPEFCASLIDEFVIYWRQRADAKESWDAVFMKWAQARWHDSRSRDSRNKTLSQELEDRSWADE